MVTCDEPDIIPVPPNVRLVPLPRKEDAETSDALIAPVTNIEPVNIDEPLTKNSPFITEAVTTPDICLLAINVAILSTHYFSSNYKIWCRYWVRF